jgi:hypothetical protein
MPTATMASESTTMTTTTVIDVSLCIMGKTRKLLDHSAYIMYIVEVIGMRRNHDGSESDYQQRA